MTQPGFGSLLLAFSRAWAATAKQRATADGGAARSRLKVFLDCDAWFEDLLRSDVDFVNYVGDPCQADLHLLVTTGRGGGEYAVTFISVGPFEGIRAFGHVGGGRRTTENHRRRELAARV